MRHRDALGRGRLCDIVWHGMDVRSFYGFFVNGLLDAAAPRLDSVGRARLCALGLDPAQRLEVYPASAVYAAVPVIAAAVSPGLQSEEAEHRLGATVVESYLASEGGPAMSAFFRQLGTRNALLDAQDFFRAGQNFLHVDARLAGERAIRLRITGTGGHAHLFRGVIEAAHHHAGEPGLRAVMQEQGPDHAVLLVTW